MRHQDLLSGVIRLHVLHHSAEGEVYGQWMIEELAEHGYRLSAGTLYPMLRSMEKRDYLVCEDRRVGRTVRRVYKATPLGAAPRPEVRSNEVHAGDAPVARERTREFGDCSLAR